MIFTGEDIPDKIYHQGEGIFLADGYPLQEVTFPKMRNIINWKRHVKELLLHTNY